LTVAVVPVRSFRLGMQRLAAVLDTDRRARLGEAVAGHVVSTLESSGFRTLVVTIDPDVSLWAAGTGSMVVGDPGGGLNAAASAGVSASLEAGERWAVVHADLPLLTARDLTELRELIEDGQAMIAPSADGGTTLLSASHPLAFSYGEGSFLRHLALLDEPLVVVEDGFLHDLDSPEDLAVILAHDHGRWLEGIY
jgi:2-phospho-L-lactate/phosphoenolpyruvate guanylyltransferase